nr:phospho-sugar mutase [Maliibacterium massiliense]
MDPQKRYQTWLAAGWLDEASRKELEAICSDAKELEDRFYTTLEFGTAGMRGVIGAGDNRMNVYTVRRATQGLADYIVSQGAALMARGVAIAYDSRRYSDVFAKEAALVLAANGIKAYLYESLRPVPQLSFALRKLRCIAGIVITASHNPPQYNGYKVYWEDGGQIPPAHAADVLACIDRIEDYGAVRTVSQAEARQKGLLVMIGKEMDDAYIARVKSLSLRPDLIEKLGDDFKVVYTPLHGTGNVPVRRVLTEIGVKHLFVVPEQELPDPDFSTVRSPNPEDHDAFTLAIAMAKKVGADVVLGTDPDCDRIGVLVSEGDVYTVLTGNQTGCLLLNYILEQRKAQGTLPKDGMVIKTIVTTELARAICADYGVQLMDVLTGFKFIAEQMECFEQAGTPTFLFGFEESYGCLTGTFVRDKDAVIASMLAVEAAAWYRSRGMTLYDGMQELYKKYGYYKESVASFALPGKDGMEKMQAIMSALRNQAPKAVGSVAVSGLRDYQSGVRTLCDGQMEALTLPSSNVLYFELADGSSVVVRPSGTEPKIKVYYMVHDATEALAEKKMDALKKAFMDIMDTYLR